MDNNNKQHFSETEDMKMTNNINSNIINSKEDMKMTNNNITKSKENKTMKRTSSIETRAKRIIRAINSGATWEEAAEREQISVGYARVITKKQFKTETRYNNFLKRAQDNKKALEQANKILKAKEEAEAKAKAEAEAKAKVKGKSEKEVKLVHLVETGFLISLLKMGKIEEFLETHRVIVIPAFCVRELMKLNNVYAGLEKVIKLCQDRRIMSMSLREETLYVDSEDTLKDRTIGVVAAACELDFMGYTVHIHTGSMEIEALANLQGADFKIERVQSLTI